MLYGIKNETVHFWDAVIIDESMWAVDKSLPVLMKINCQTWLIEDTIDLWDFIHNGVQIRKMFCIKNVIYMVPLYGYQMLTYDIVKKKADCIFFSDAQDNRHNADAICFENNIYLIPRNLSGEILKYETSQGVISSMGSIREKTGTEFLNKDSYQIIHGICCDGVLWTVIQETNYIINMNLNSEKVTFFRLDDNFRFADIIFDTEYFWLIDLDSRSLIRWTDYQKTEIHIFPIHQKNAIYKHMANIDKYVVLIPAGEGEYCAFNKDTEEMKPVLKAHTTLPFSKGTLSYGYCVNRNKLYLFPHAIDALLIFAEDKIEIHEIKYVINPVIVRAYLRSRNGVLVEEKDGSFKDYIDEISIMDQNNEKVEEHCVGEKIMHFTKMGEILK